jgi:hypothetical protein
MGVEPGSRSGRSERRRTKDPAADTWIVRPKTAKRK